MNKHIVAVCLFLLAICMGIFNSVFLKKVGLQSLYSTYELISIRSIVAFTILLPFFLTKKVNFITKDNLKLNILFASFSIISSYCWHYGLSIVYVNNAVIISYIVPFVILLLSRIVLKEKISKRLVFSVIIIFTFIVVIQKPKNFFNFGYLLILTDVMFYSSSIVLSKKLMIKKQSPIAVFFFKVIIVMITSCHCVPSVVDKISISNINTLYALLIGVVYCIENIIFFVAYSLTNVSKLQPLFYTKICFSAIFSYFLLGEHLLLSQIILASVIILSNCYLIFNKNK